MKKCRSSRFLLLPLLADCLDSLKGDEHEPITENVGSSYSILQLINLSY